MNSTLLHCLFEFRWEKFLKLRGNEMWINIAIECSEFRIEHKEEYEKCSNMLQAIMDNRSLE